MKGFDKVYPFTTEKISSYFPALNLADKSILTVGSSCDQVFNALVCGAGRIVVYDINPRVAEFYKIKREAILSLPRKELVPAILSTPNIPFMGDRFLEERLVSFNNYLQSDENYELLRERLADSDVSFMVGDVFKMREDLGDEKFDRILLSNVLQYIEYFFPDDDPYLVLANNFPEWQSHLSEKGILQFAYLYNYSIDKIRTDARRRNINKKQVFPSAIYNVLKVYQTLDNSDLDIMDFKGVHGFTNNRDSIITYTKRWGILWRIL